ncbi:MAG: hypothetical protein BWY57_02322 [Betaproteobacteria bacterium ADurb.Bin341]|nr:MAG: hypothetical protein BWY57_02322 [Betaproteobacteria bacterium ADurb.Bin341]
MPIPNKPLLWLCAAWFALGLAAVVSPGLALAWKIAGAALLVVALADLFAGRQRRGSVSVSREVHHALPVGTWQTVYLRLTAKVRICGWLSDRHPPEFGDIGLPLFFRLEPGRWLKAGYRILVTERGRQEFTAVDLRLCSPLRLWLIAETLPVTSSVRVYPDFARITQYTLLATDNRLSQIGVLQRRRRGEGMEFHQLRDYRQEDSPRQIDWKASSRMGRLISREYQDERDQQIVFLLDCGSRMRARDSELSHFDHTLNAILLLSYVALGQGDAVGLSTFGHEHPRYLPPKKSVATVNRLLNTVYDLQPTLQTPDYLVAAESLLKHLSKRTLIILVTNVRDEDDDTLGPAMTLLRRRHAVTLASLKETVLDELIEAPVTDFDTALTRAASLEYLHARRRQTAILRHGGVQIVDVRPHQLPVALINHYWERKRAGAL